VAIGGADTLAASSATLTEDVALIANRYPPSMAGQEQALQGDTLRGRRAAKLGAIRFRSDSDWKKPARYEASGRIAVPHVML
jgi:hypothetical protein